ncbi:hypothetical protein ACQJBY_038393 [Aegilops geniculata]
MEGKKERVMAGAVFVLVILLSPQWLPVGVADPMSAFCQCYLGCFDPDCSGEGWQSCHDYCCAQVCHLPGDADFDRVCGAGYQASACDIQATDVGTTSTSTTDDAAANYWSGRHGKAKAKHG